MDNIQSQASTVAGKEDLQAMFREEENSFWNPARVKLIIQLLKKFKLSGPDKVFCEHGSGTGYISYNLLNHFKQIVSTEAQPEGIKLLIDRYQLKNISEEKYQTYSCLVQNFPSEQKFDVIAMLDVMEHIAPHDLPEIFISLAKQLKDSGSLLLTVPALMSLWSEFDVVSRHFKRFTVENFTELVEENGFEVYYCSYFMFFVLPFVYIQRWLMNINKNSVQTQAIKNPSKINSLFSFLCLLDRLLLRVFPKLPSGSSLVCLARKKTTN